MATRKRPCTSDEDEHPEEPQLKVGTSLKLALGDLYQETVQLRGDVKELKADVNNVLKNQDRLSQDLKHIAEILASKSEVSKSSAAGKKIEQQNHDEEKSESSEDIGVNNEDTINKEEFELEDHFGQSRDEACQTDPVTILPDDITKTNGELKTDIKAILQNQTTLSFNMRSIYDMLNKHGTVSAENHAVFIEPNTATISSPATKYHPEAEDIAEIRPPSIEIQYVDPGPSSAVEVKTLSPPVPIPQSLLASGVLKPVPKIIPGPYAGTFLVGGDSTLVRDIAEYESILMQIYTKKPLEADVEKARGLLRHLFRMVIPSEILATCNVTGKSRDAVTHRWIRVPKIDEALLLPIFNQTRLQFPEFTDWYTDEKSRTVQYLNNVCKTVRHSSRSSTS